MAAVIAPSEARGGAAESGMARSHLAKPTDIAMQTNDANESGEARISRRLACSDAAAKRKRHRIGARGGRAGLRGAVVG